MLRRQPRHLRVQRRVDGLGLLKALKDWLHHRGDQRSQNRLKLFLLLLRH